MVRNDDVENAAGPQLYRGERYGNITYVIVPVANYGCLNAMEIVDESVT